MAITTAQQFMDVWTELDALYVAISGATQNGTGDTAQFGDYEDATTFTHALSTTDIGAAGGFYASVADDMASGQPIGEAALAVNLAFIELAKDYIVYLEGGGEPLLDIAKDRGPGNPGQSFHDNILGNLIDVAVQDRFGDHAGLNIDITGDAVDDVVADPRGLAAGAGERPYYDGFAADADDLAESTAWDIANGVPRDFAPLAGNVYLVSLTDDGNEDVTVFGSIQAAIDVANAGDTIVVGAGTYDEDLVISEEVTILGAQAGNTGTAGGRDAATGAGETTIIGRHDISASGPVTIDGVRFLNDATTSGGGSGDPTLNILNGNGHVVTNSIFFSEVAGGANGVDDRAISLPPIASGDVTISNNYFTGSQTGLFGTASWGRAIWFDGGGVDLVVTGNTFEFSRTGINLDTSGTSQADVHDNVFRSDGTAVSIGLNPDQLDMTGNDFQNVGTEFNFRNLTDDIIFDADVAVDLLTPADPNNDLVVVLGGSGNDTLSGTENADVLDGNNHPTQGANSDADTLNGRGGNDTLFGRGGDDTLNGGDGDDTLDGGDGDDTLGGGDGTDATDYGTTLTSGEFHFGPGPGGGWSVDASGDGEGTDTLDDVERVTHGGTGRFLLVGGNGYASLQAAQADLQAGDTILLPSEVSAVTDGDGADGGSVAEQAATGAAVGIDANAEDVGAGAGALTFSLSNDAGGRFMIDATTGVVTVANGALIDFEAATSHQVTVVATNQWGDSEAQTFTIAVTDVVPVTETGGKGDDVIDGTVEADTLDGGKGNDTVSGGGGNDALDGGKGDDVIDGGDGDDSLTGGKGADTITGGDGVDEVSYEDSKAGVKIDLEKTGAQKGGDAKGDTLASIENLVGSDEDDVLKGNAADNVLEGLKGDDLLDGRGGTDMLIGGKGDDTFVFSSGYGADTVTDYKSGDAFDLEGTGIAKFKDLKALMSETGGDVVIDLGGGDMLTIAGTTIQKLSQNKGDFDLA